MKNTNPLGAWPAPHDSANSPRKVFRCFAPPRWRSTPARTWFAQWSKEFSTLPLIMKSKHQEALARLAPALLCGEQSAINLFRIEDGHLTRKTLHVSVTLLHGIENDETAHEASLQVLRANLPAASDEHAIRRRSQAYFASLGRAETVAHHFGQVSQLDSAVCAIMWYMEHSAVGGNSMLGRLVEHIRHDEARHVSISRRHAFALGLSRDDYSRLGELVRGGLTGMLEHVADSFEDIGIDAGLLFTRIKRGAL
ncbi:conserved hypothetical protein [Candidatus Nitrospira nitrificans]|uniref:Uncharacterized protein n=1 Tax=Candidatus Nitrospira nitrificans TaxID=1742973 RepID=A0A0S4LSC2_9BACT|nr:conserved hypothetical protein [Candidatus Nitrospira nitrificans]